MTAYVDRAGRITAPLAYYEQRGTLRVNAITHESSMDLLPHVHDVEGHFMVEESAWVAMRKIGGRRWWSAYSLDQVIDFVPYVKPVKL